LIIAEYQADVTYRGPKVARDTFLPLDARNWITCGNALRLDWLDVCPPTGKSVKLTSEDLFDTPLDQAEIDFENEGGETYICGNPPYVGSKWQNPEQKDDLRRIFDGRVSSWKSLDYVSGWFMKASDYARHTPTVSAYVTTNSVCQGGQVPILWGALLDGEQEIQFAHRDFKWSNLASHNAGVTVVIVAITRQPTKQRRLFFEARDGDLQVKTTDNINPYLLAAPSVIVEQSRTPLNRLSPIADGSGPLDGGHLLLETSEKEKLVTSEPGSVDYLKKFLGSQEIIKGTQRWCLWIEDVDRGKAEQLPKVKERIDAVETFRRSAGTRAQTAIGRPHKFAWINQPEENQIAIPKVFSERREYITCDYFSSDTVVSNRACIVLDPELHEFALISSRLHWAWIATVCVRLRTDISYSGTIGWNTFPVPKLTEKNKADLTRCAEDILLAREAHFPATIADLYKPDAMPENLRAAHDRNDEVLERIYIGRRFRNDTERLEKLFEMYTKMTTKVPQE
jgi:hypothetical protein